MVKLILAFIVSCSFTLAHADANKVKATLQKKYPELGNVQQVHKSNILGLYEVVMDGQLFYTDAKARYLINGHIFDLQSKRNLTEERSRKLFAVEFDKLPFELALKKVKGNGQRKLAYFTDPNCGYCQQLEAELKKIDNVTLYMFMLTLFNGSEEKVSGVLCSADPVKAWDDLMLNQIQPPAGSCETPTAKAMELSRKMNVNGTPALIFADGVVVPGYIPAAEIEKSLSATAAR